MKLDPRIGKARHGVLATTRRLRRADPSWALGLAGIIGATLAVSVAWATIDHRTPEWDQANYLDLALHYAAALHTGGVPALLHEVWVPTAPHPPLFQLSLAAAFVMFGASPTSGLIVNLLLWPVLILSVADIASHLSDRRVGLVAAAITATMPLMVGLAHQVLQDFELATIVTLAIAALLRTRSFSSWRASLLLGVILGIGSWTKPTYPAFVIGPLALVLMWTATLALKERRAMVTRSLAKARVVNASGTLLVALLVAAAWYLPHISSTLAYVHRATAGIGSVGMGPANPLTLHNVAVFTVNFIDTAVSLPITLAAVVGALIVVPLWALRHGLRRGAGDRRTNISVAFLVVWVAVPYLSVATSHNQQTRYLSAAMPAIAILAAELIVAIPLPVVRWCLVGAVCILGSAFAVGMTWPYHVPGLPSELAVATRFGWLTYPVSPPPSIGFALRPEPTAVMAPVMTFVRHELVEQARAHPTVCVLGNDADVNVNTVGFLSDEGRDHYLVESVYFDGRASLMRKDLLSCSAALWVLPQAGAPEGPRVALLDQAYAKDHMTPADLRVFSGATATFPIDYGEHVRVLIRGRT